MSAVSELATVTLLFTDIETSTSLWERFPAAMHLLVAEHETLLRECVERHGGSVFKWVGDGVCAVMPTPGAAASAACDVQAQHAADPKWRLSNEHGVKVRIAFHTCACGLRNGDYFGLGVSQLARVLAAGYGGQILSSDASALALHANAELAPRLIDLGTHQLRGLTEPVRIYELRYAEQTGPFGPLRTYGSFPTNLPAQMTRFFGRAEELAQLGSRIAEHRLITITGPGGSGKSRLALHAAESVIDRFSGGTFLVELASTRAPEQTLPAIAAAVGVREETGADLMQQIGECLRGKPVLLIVHNCEHLIDACAQSVETLMRLCPELRVIATSRTVLRIDGECVLRLSTLPVPSEGEASRLDEMHECASVQLLIDRVQLVSGTFRLSPGNAAAVAKICRRLDGIPLALELAAARAGSMSLEQIAGRVDESLRLLTRGRRTALPRQQTLRAAIDWSYDLLTEPERALLTDLSVFAGGWSLEAAEAVCTTADSAETEMLELLTGLADRSLIQLDTADPPRYRMLETIREYCAARRAQRAAEEDTGLQRRHIRYLVRLCRNSSEGLQGPDEPRWSKLIVSEMDNIRASMQFGLQNDVESALRLATRTHYFAIIRGWPSECRRWLEEGLAKAPSITKEDISAKALIALGNIQMFQADGRAAARCFEAALGLAHQTGDRSLTTVALCNLAYAQVLQGLALHAAEQLEVALAEYRSLQDARNVAAVETFLGVAYEHMGEWDSASEAYLRGLEHSRACGYTGIAAEALDGLGGVRLRERKIEEALELFRDGLSNACDAQNAQSLASLLSGMAAALAAGAQPALVADCLHHAAWTAAVLGSQHDRRVASRLAQARRLSGVDEANIEPLPPAGYCLQHSFEFCKRLLGTDIHSQQASCA